MKLILLFFTAFLLHFQTSTLEKIRASFPTASATKQSAASFSALVKNADSDAAAQGYKAAAKMIQAKFEQGNSRKTLMTEGIKSLESLISKNSANTELRLIRLSIQENLPKIVGYNKNIKDDKALIIKNYSKENAALKKYIKSFSTASKSMTPAEKASLK